MDTFARPAEGAGEQKQDQEPLTLALSRRERGLTGVLGRDSPTCDTALNSSIEKPTNRLPLLGERAGVRGKIHHKTKAEHALLPPLNTTSVSSSTAFDAKARRQAEWRD
jgi:hypothetical protein